MASITVTFFTKVPTQIPSRRLDFKEKNFMIIFDIFLLDAPILLTPNRITLSSKDLLTSVNGILNALNLPIVDVPKQQKQTDQHNIEFKIIDIEKFYDFTKIPKVSIEYE